MSGLWYEPVRWIEDREWMILRPTVLATFSSKLLTTVVLQSTTREFTKERTARAARICFLRPTNHITWFMASSSTLPSLRWQLPALFCYSLPLVSTLPHEAVMRKCFVRISLHGVVYLVYRVKPAIFDLFLAVGIASYLGLFYLAVMVSLKLIKTLCWRCQPPLKSDSDQSSLILTVSRLSGDKINCIITWSKRFTRRFISRWL